MKKCTHCNREKPLNEWSVCRQCVDRASIINNQKPFRILEYVERFEKVA